LKVDGRLINDPWAAQKTVTQVIEKPSKAAEMAALLFKRKKPQQMLDHPRSSPYYSRPQVIPR
jgi:hypothetical protein